MGITHDEGLIINGEYEYNIKDHLGNLRIAFRDSLGIAKITQSNSYGAWGEELPSISYYKAQWKKDEFKFTGKENLPETGYIDFGARLYDNLVPRFITIDPLAETSRRFSPFTYGNNNPIRFIDPDGMQAEDSKNNSNYVPTNFEYSDGYSTQNSRNTTGSVSFEGAYQNSDGGGGGDKPKVNTKPTNNTATYAAGAAAMTLRTGISAAAEGGIGFSLGEGTVAALGRGAVGGGLGLLLAGIFSLGGDLTADIPITGVGTKTDDNNNPIFFHYTDNVGYLGIMSSKKILPDVKGNVYLTNAAFSSTEAFRDLF